MATFDGSVAETGGTFTAVRPVIRATWDSSVSRPADVGGGGPTVVYRMRGFDQNGSVNDYVYWDSTEVDADASDYSGSAGPVVDIVLQKVLGA